MQYKDIEVGKTYGLNHGSERWPDIVGVTIIEEMDAKRKAAKSKETR